MRYIEACENQEWHLKLSEIAEDGEILPEKPFCYRCRSWRHAGPCRMWKGAHDFVRIAEAIDKYQGWVFCVLTFAKRDWPDWKEQYIVSGEMWSAMRLRMTRKFGKFPYIQTWERHQSGGLHVNLLVGSEGLRKGCYEDLRDPFEEVRWFNDDLEEMAHGVGFGRVHWAEPMRDSTKDGMAGYFVKLANELVGAGKKNQIPFDAPKHFRRLRASRGLLPKAKESEMTGRLVFDPPPDGALDFLQHKKN